MPESEIVDYARALQARPVTAPRFWHTKALSNRLQPVVGVSWFEAHAFCGWLGRRLGVVVRLPSENEWEAACLHSFGLTRSEEIPPMVDQIRFFAGAARMLHGLSAGEYMAGFTSMIRREPIGVVGQVTPWNYPMMMAVWKIAPAIAAGNTVVLNPRDTPPLTTLRLAELAADILPAGVFNVVCGDRQL